MSDFRDCADKLKAMVKIEDEIRDLGNEAAAANVLYWIDLAIVELANTIRSSAEYISLLEDTRDNYISLINSLGFCTYASETMFADVVSPNPGDTPERGLQEFMAARQLTGTTWRFTNGAAGVTCPTTDGAALTEVQAGDYIFLEVDTVTWRSLVLAVVNDDTITLNAAYGGAGGDGNGIIEQTFTTRGVTKAYTNGDTMGNKARLFWGKTDDLGYDIETPLRTNTFKFRCTDWKEYSGLLELVCMVSGRPHYTEGEQSDILDTTGCRFGEELEKLQIVNSFNEGVLSVNAATMDTPIAATAANLANNGWYSADWSNSAIEAVYFHRDEDSKDPTNWTGIGRSLEMVAAGAHTQAIELDKELFDYRQKYICIMIYKFDDHDTDGTLGFDVGAVSTTTTGQAATTANISVVNGNTALTGAAGSKFTEELAVGDKVRMNAHAGAVATEIASIESDTAATFVAGGYLGATLGPAAGVVHHTGWHMLEYQAFPEAFMPAGDLELDVYRNAPTTGSCNVYSIQIFPMARFDSLGAHVFIYAGQTDIAPEDEITVQITIAADKKVQRWMVENTFESYPHAVAPSVTDPA